MPRRRFCSSGFASLQLGHFLGQFRERFLARAKPLERHGTLLQPANVDVDLFDRRRSDC
jgi:Resolvase, N terminal domain